MDARKVKQIIYETFKVNHIKIKPADEGSVSNVFIFSISKQKYVIKFVGQTTLYNEIYFFNQAHKARVCVPQVLKYNYSTTDNCYYIMEFMGGHNNPDKNTNLFFNETIKSIKKIHAIKLKGFGRNVSRKINKPIFEHATLYKWFEYELKRLKQAFKDFYRKDVIDALGMMQSNYKKFIKNTSTSCLVHGDLGFGNLIFNRSRVCFIDPGWNRAFNHLWEVAYFDYKYLNHPQKAYRSQLFKKMYFPNGVTENQELEVAIYRTLCSIETYRWYLTQKNLNKNEARSRFLRNYKRLKTIL